MKYYFVQFKGDGNGIVVAKDLESAKLIALNEDENIENIYQLEDNTFKDEGFLMVDWR